MMKQIDGAAVKALFPAIAAGALAGLFAFSYEATRRAGARRGSPRADCTPSAASEATSAAQHLLRAGKEDGESRLFTAEPGRRSRSNAPEGGRAMLGPPYEQVIAWVGLALLVLLCLPLPRIQKVVLELSARGLRLALLGLLGAAAYLWFRPEDLPAEVSDAIAAFPPLADVLPAPGAQHFGICAAALIVVPLLPLLAALDVARKLAGRRLGRLRALAAEAKAPEAAPAPPAPPAPVRRIDRRSAASALADAGSRRPFGAPGRPES
jgi:hypothetical protein